MQYGTAHHQPAPILLVVIATSARLKLFEHGKRALGALAGPGRLAARCIVIRVGCCGYRSGLGLVLLPVRTKAGGQDGKIRNECAMCNTSGTHQYSSSSGPFLPFLAPFLGGIVVGIAAYAR